MERTWNERACKDTTQKSGIEEKNVIGKMRFDRFRFSKYEGAAKIHTAECRLRRRAHTRTQRDARMAWRIRWIVSAESAIWNMQQQIRFYYQNGRIHCQRKWDIWVRSASTQTRIFLFCLTHFIRVRFPRLASVIVAPVDGSRSTPKASTEKKHEILLPFRPSIGEYFCHLLKRHDHCAESAFPGRRNCVVTWQSRPYRRANASQWRAKKENKREREISYKYRF